MQALRFSVRRGRSSLWVATQKRSFANESFVPADIPVVLKKKKSVETVATLTSTMRNVAAGKLPSCQKFLVSTRPFAAVTQPMFETLSPVENKKGVHLHLVIGAERGLCGMVGSNIPRMASAAVRANKKNSPEIVNKVVVVGNNTISKQRGQIKEDVVLGINKSKPKMPTFATCLELTDYLFKNFEFGRLTMYYTEFKNISKYEGKVYNTYDLATCEEIGSLQFGLYDVEGDERTIMQNLQEFKFASTLYNCMAEQLASEMASRLASMEGASKTCKEKSLEYFQIYQKLRKQKITNELTVLSIGAKMAKKKK